MSVITKKGIAIQYGDIALEAKENFVPTASESEFDTLSQLQKYNLKFLYYANPCEQYQTVLDGTASAFPSVLDNANVGLTSEQISGADGIFATPIVLTMTSTGQYSSIGFTLTFDRSNDIYATRVGIKWIRETIENGIEVLDEQEFTPNSAYYFCSNAVNNYTKVIFTFHSINMPYNRLKLMALDYGYGTVFYGDEIRSAKQIQEQNPISTEITINTFDFTLDSKENIAYSFQEKQPISVYFNGALISTNFVTKATRKSRFLWDVQSEDYIGTMDNKSYYGGMYENANALDIIDDIFTVAQVPYDIADADLSTISTATVTGHIPNCTCREALMQVLFAIQAVADTSNSDVVNIFMPHETIDATVTLDRIMQGQNFVDNEVVTGVELTMHKYKTLTDVVEVYNAEKSGDGNNILVRFSEPVHDLSISDGTFVQDANGNDLKGVNYCIINAGIDCVVTGQKYEHLTRVKSIENPLILATQKEKNVVIQNATLVSIDNINNVLEKCYNWHIRNSETNLKIVEGKHVIYGDYIKYGEKKYGEFKYSEKYPDVITYDERVNIGENIKAETEYYGLVGGRIIKETFNLNGNIVVKEAVIR